MNDLPVIVTLVLGFLGVIFSVINQNSRFTELNNRFGDLKEAINHRFDEVNKRLDDVNRRLDRIEQKQDSHEGRITRLEEPLIHR